MNEKEMLREALEIGFHSAAFIDTEELVIVPEYRRYCEMNLCHMYDANPACPPQSGTVEEMTERVRSFKRALILQTECESDFADDPQGAILAKKKHNELADRLIERLEKDRIFDCLRMSAGPWKKYSCMSAYCVDAQKMADAAGMLCWARDGKSRFFSLLLM